MLQESHQPRLADFIEKALDVDLEYPVHLCAGDPDHQGVQRSVLAALGSEPIRKAEEILVVDRIQHRGSRPLDNLVFEGGDAACIMHLVQFGLGDRMAMREELATQSRSLRSIASVIVMTYGRPGFLFCAVMRPPSIQ